MDSRISFLCPNCKARLRAAPRLAARCLPCPGCRSQVTVPLQAPPEQAPLLVFDDGHNLSKPQPKWVC